MASICCSPPDKVPGALFAALGQYREEGIAAVEVLADAVFVVSW
jgi:hypothetical protein